MKFKRHMQLEQGLKQIDIAPLIDIVFQLLIFFMLTASFITPAGIKVNLPRTVSSETAQDESVNIIITAENVTYLNERVVTLNELKAQLKKNKNKPILIRADRRSSLGRVVEIWDAARDLGISNINIATIQSE
ncbi:MAG: biopolymer transporter ExbD [Candidatus Omnitrophota bacterium]